MNRLKGSAALCFLCSTSWALAAERFQIRAAVPPEALAACMYREIRDEAHGEVAVNDIGGGAKEIARTTTGLGSSVFKWRVDIRRDGPHGSIAEAKVARPLFGPGQHEDEVRRLAEACARG